MKKLFGNIWFNMLFIVSLTVLALVFALYDSYESVWNTIKHLDPYKLFLILALGVLPYLCWGWILTTLGRTLNPKFKFKHGMINAYVAGFMSGITPSSTGGQFAQVYAFKKHGMKASQGAGLVSMDFYIYQIAFVITAIIMYVTYLSTYTHVAISLVFGIGLFFNSFVVIVLWIMVEFPKLYHKLSFWAIHLLHKMKFIKNKEKILKDWNDTLEHFNEAIENVKENKSIFWKILGLNILKNILYFSTPFFIAAILGIPVNYRDFFPMVALGCFVSTSNTFVPLPGASGATEGLFVVVFSTVIGKGGAASTMILWRLANFYMPVLIGGYLFIRLRNLNPFKPIQTADLLEDNDKQD